MPKTIFSAEQEQLQKLLRDAREKAGLTQMQVAKKLQVPQSVISKYESGERRLDVIELRRVCKALGITLIDFVKKLESL